MRNSTFKFPTRTNRIQGDRRSGKTTECANVLIDALLENKSVLVVLPTGRMQEVFKNYYHTVVEQRGIQDMTYFKMDHYILAMAPWGKRKDTTYDVIIFVDGPDDDRNPVFNGPNYAFNLGSTIWSILDWHANHVLLVGGKRPQFYVSYNPWNAIRETSQLWIIDANDLKRRDDPTELLEKLQSLWMQPPEIQSIIASKISFSEV